MDEARDTPAQTVAGSQAKQLGERYEARLAQPTMQRAEDFSSALRRIVPRLLYTLQRNNPMLRLKRLVGELVASQCKKRLIRSNRQLVLVQFVVRRSL